MCSGVGKRDFESGRWISAEEMKQDNSYEEWLESEMEHYKFYHIFWCRWDEDNRWYSPKQWLPNFWTWFQERAEYRSNGGVAWKVVQFVWAIQGFVGNCLIILEWDRTPHAENRGLFKDDWKTKWGFWEYVYCRTLQMPLGRFRLWFRQRILGQKPIDDHLGCYSWPNCDIDPNGCKHIMGDDVECYGHKD